MCPWLTTNLIYQRLAEAHTIKSPFVRQMLGIIDTKMLRIESAERENIDKISTAIDELKKNTEIQHPTPPSPTIPAPASEDPLFNAVSFFFPRRQNPELCIPD